MEALIKPEFGLSFWTILVFFLLVFILARTVWKPLLKAVEDRENKIKNDIEAANRAKEEAEKIKQEIQDRLNNLKAEIELRLSNANSQALQEREKIIEAAKKEAASILENARREIENAKNTASKELQKEVVNIAIEISKKTIAEIVDKQMDAKLNEVLSKKLLATTKEKV